MEALENHPLVEQKKTSSLRSFFERIAFLRMSDEKKTEVAQEILEDTYGSKLYWLELILSCIIATL